MSEPKRIQLRRTKGWHKPEGAIVVARPSRWGNPYTLAAARDAGYEGTDADLRGFCVAHFKVWLNGEEPWSAGEDRRERILLGLPGLRGHDLACWCPLDQPCHADVLLEIANVAGPSPDTGETRAR